MWPTPSSSQLFPKREIHVDQRAGLGVFQFNMPVATVKQLRAFANRGLAPPDRRPSRRAEKSAGQRGPGILGMAIGIAVLCTSVRVWVPASPRRMNSAPAPAASPPSFPSRFSAGNLRDLSLLAVEEDDSMTQTFRLKRQAFGRHLRRATLSSLHLRHHLRLHILDELKCVPAHPEVLFAMWPLVIGFALWRFGAPC